MAGFLKKKWSLKFSFLKVGIPSLIVYFFTTIFTIFLKNPFNILFQLLFFFWFSFISFKSTQNFEKIWLKTLIFLFQILVLYIIPFLLYFLLLGFLLSGWDPKEFGKYN